MHHVMIYLFFNSDIKFSSLFSWAVAKQLQGQKRVLVYRVGQRNWMQDQVKIKVNVEAMQC